MEARKGRRLGLKIRAVLAGGLALGVGATVTLAAWNDSEYATTNVTASTFNIVGNMAGGQGTGGSFTQHDTVGTAGAVTYTPSLAAVSPGSVSFGTIQIRTTAETTIDGSVIVQQAGAAPTGAFASALRYGIRVAPSPAACTQALFDSTSTAPVVVPNDTPFTTGVPATNPAQPLSPAAGNTVTYCARISLMQSASPTLQGSNAATTWQFLATSSS